MPASSADSEVGSKRKADDDGCGEERAGAGAGPDAKRAATVDDDRRLSLIDNAFDWIVEAADRDDHSGTKAFQFFQAVKDIAKRYREKGPEKETRLRAQLQGPLLERKVKLTRTIVAAVMDDPGGLADPAEVAKREQLSNEMLALEADVRFGQVKFGEERLCKILDVCKEWRAYLGKKASEGSDSSRRALEDVDRIKQHVQHTLDSLTAPA